MDLSVISPGSLVMVQFEDGFKSHYCSAELAGDLIADIEARGGSLRKVEEVPDGWIELPGVCMSDRPVERVQVDGFSFSTPSQDFEVFASELVRSPLRRFASGKEYHKIHGWLTCMVFSPGQRDKVLDAMGGMLEGVLKRAKEADEEFSRRMAKINEDKIRVVSARNKNSPYVKRVPAPKKENN